MRPAARLSAGIEVLADVIDRHRPVGLALADWGKSHRFAGSSDRAAIGNLVYDALRKRRSVAARMGDEGPRALVLGIAAEAWGLAPEEVVALCDGSEHAPSAPSEREREGVLGTLAEDLPEDVRADVPEWLWPAFLARFGDRALAEGRALAGRAPVDLRTNTLKADREKVLKALDRFGAAASPHSPWGVRISPPEAGGRTPNVQVEPAFLKGWFEVQDESSQIAALVARLALGGGTQALDFCAGAGGKTLALAAAMGNRGQIFAFDADRARLAPIHDRLKRAGARNVQVLPVAEAPPAQLEGRMDLVLIDAPCTGTGIWRRRPEAKWRLTPEALARRIEEQDRILDQAAAFVRPGGRLLWVTCSLLPAENEERLEALVRRQPGFRALPIEALGRNPGVAIPGFNLGSVAPAGAGTYLVLSPASSNGYGFVVGCLERWGETVRTL